MTKEGGAKMSISEIKRLEKEAERIRIAANYCDDPYVFRSEIARAAQLELEAKGLRITTTGKGRKEWEVQKGF